MVREFFTVIIVPHARAKFRRFQVPVRIAKWVAGVSGILALTVCGILTHYAFITSQVHELHQLRAQNADLVSRTQQYERNTTLLQAKVGQLQNMVTKLGVMAGLEQSLPDPQVGGVGGVPSLDSHAPPGVSPEMLQGMDQNVSRLTQQSERLEEFFRDQKVQLAQTPSIWPVRGYVSATFGNRIDPFTGQWDFHSGLDVSTPIGTKVVAPADGVVVSAGVKGAYGNAITLNHGYGVVTQYGHLERFVVRPGQRVRRGDVIGFVGNSGRSTGPHLHYEVWIRDQAKNPIHYILDEYRSFG
jgi:murein DD-endopeptidase MepM/ murein hydrolase activator NlpD